MDRRHFCKIGALSLGAVVLGIIKGYAAVNTQKGGGSSVMPCDCRISVVRMECYEDLQSMYLDDPEEGPCRSFHVGEKWNIKSGDVCPPGFCTHAWDALVASVSKALTLRNGGCCKFFNDGVRVVSCPDGSRPVIFRVEINA